MRMESGIRENITHVSGRTASLDYEQHAAVLCGTVMAVGGGGWGHPGVKQPLPKMAKAEQTLLINLRFSSGCVDSAGLGGLCVRRSSSPPQKRVLADSALR